MWHRKYSLICIFFFLLSSSRIKKAVEIWDLFWWTNRSEYIWEIHPIHVKSILTSICLSWSWLITFNRQRIVYAYKIAVWHDLPKVHDLFQMGYLFLYMHTFSTTNIKLDLKSLMYFILLIQRKNPCRKIIFRMISRW